MRVAQLGGAMGTVDVDERPRDHDARPVIGAYDAKDAQEGLLPQAFYVHDARGNLQVRIKCTRLPVSRERIE